MQTGNGALTVILAAVVGVIVLIAVLIGAAASALLGGGGDGAGDIACVLPSSTTIPDVPGLDTTQTANAEIIISVAAQMGLPAQAAVIAVATAMQESRLRDLDYGDQDSLGLFQQRPSQGWGTPAEILDPEYAARAFYTRLITIPGWQTLPLTVAAQDVQHSGYPDAYAQWQNLAEQAVAALTGSACNQAGDDNRGMVAAQWALAQLGKPYQWGAAGPDSYDCSGLVMVAWEHAGIQLGRTTYIQWTEGTPVPENQLQPGDLVFFEPSPQGPGHVGIYIGDSKYVDAPETGQNVRIDSLGEPWSIAEYVGARRPD
jgi:hypothetical protein